MPQCLAILAPSGRDATVIDGILKGAGVATSVEGNIDALIDALEVSRAGGLIVAEEALADDRLVKLERFLDGQAPWSDLPGPS